MSSPISQFIPPPSFPLLGLHACSLHLSLFCKSTIFLDSTYLH